METMNGKIIDGVRFVDEGSGAVFEGWTDGAAIGYRVTHGNGAVEYLYLNPATTVDADVYPCAFLYRGPEGDPCQDGACHFYDLKAGQ